MLIDFNTTKLMLAFVMLLKSRPKANFFTSNLWFFLMPDTYHIFPLDAPVQHLAVVDLTESVVGFPGKFASVAGILHLGTSKTMGSQDSYNLLEIILHGF